MKFIQGIPDVAPDEIAIETHEGEALVFPSSKSEHGQGGVDYVRFVRIKDGAELVYWNSDEWENEPKGVMGALLGAMCSGTEVGLKDRRDVARKMADALKVARQICEKEGTLKPESEFWHGIHSCPPASWDKDEWLQQVIPLEEYNKIQKLNPSGTCVYDLYVDPAFDNCIFCDLPHERK